MLRMHAHYQQIVQKAEESHAQNRNPSGIDCEDIMLARLYSYALRLHIIGTFHATRIALKECPLSRPEMQPYRTRTLETLEDLANQSMETVPRDFRVVITTFHRYHRGIIRVLEGLEWEAAVNREDRVRDIARRFRFIVEEITGECGIHLTQDMHAPKQGGFVVPGLGITIVPLVYGDHHSWNLAWLAGDEHNVPTHRHHHGVEIHLGYNPTHGMTVLGNSRAVVDEGYAMPIPPETDHGWVNTADEIHHVSFIFGSLEHAGWGVFLDVEPRPDPVDALKLVDRDSTEFSQMIYLEREIDKAARMASSWRKTLIPYTVTQRGKTGGLELGLMRVNPNGQKLPVGEFRVVSIVRGQGLVRIEGIERAAQAHDHFGVPAGMTCEIHQTGDKPLVALDAIITSYSGRATWQT